MLASDQVEEMICLLATWDRDMLTRQFVNFRSSFPVDLSEDFMAKMSVDRLRHIFLALCLQNQRLPEVPSFDA